VAIPAHELRSKHVLEGSVQAKGKESWPTEKR
jgi:hypothetical protein